MIIEISWKCCFEEKLTNLGSVLKAEIIYFVIKDPANQNRS